MKKVLVVGAGRMGGVIAYALDKLGYQVFKYDSDPTKCDEQFKDMEFYEVDLTGYNAVISSATYTANLEIAKQSIDAGVPYFDLGGHVGTSKEIQEFAKANNGLVFTDLGLAPGLVNILGEFALDDLERMGEKPVSIDLRVGGLPSFYADMGLLKYNLTWSVEGLINEYLDKCKILWDKEVQEVDGLSGLEEIDWGDNLKFEAFHTSGGLSHTLDSAIARGLSDARYKTIRYKGHAQQVRFLLEACDGDRELLVKLIKNCSVSHNQDSVWVYVKAKGKYTTIEKRYMIPYSKDFTAMQRATAFSAAAVVANIVSQTSVGFLTTFLGDSNVLSYRSVNKENFLRNMEKLGIKL